jgi:hypothetical protein
VNSELDEVPDPEQWQLWNHGIPAVHNLAVDHTLHTDQCIEQTMPRRMRRLEHERNATSNVDDIDDAMDVLAAQISECDLLMYGGVRRCGLLLA